MKLLSLLWVAFLLMACGQKTNETASQTENNLVTDSEVLQMQTEVARIISTGDISQMTPQHREVLRKINMTLSKYIKKVENEKHIYLDLSKEEYDKMGLNTAFYDKALKDLEDINHYLDTTSVPNAWKDISEMIQQFEEWDGSFK